MLTQLRDLWARRPVVILLTVAVLVFGLTLSILLVAIGGSGPTEPEIVALSETQQQQSEQPRHETVVKVDTQVDQDQSAQTVQESQPSDQQDEPGTAASDAAEQQEASAQQQSDTAQQSVPEESDEPAMVAGFVVRVLSSVLEDEYDEDLLRHGSDGSEGGILPIDNGVVRSSGPEHETSWELIVPSAGIRSAVVRVAKTPSGAMGSPDNPHVIGWLDSSAAPGESGNTLLAGHRDFEDIAGNVGTGVCWELINTDVGDQMLVRDNEHGIYYVYSVIEAETIDPYDPDAARFLKDTSEPVVTLITCEGSFNAETHQYSHRRVVVGVLSAVATPDA